MAELTKQETEAFKELYAKYLKWFGDFSKSNKIDNPSLTKLVTEAFIDGYFMAVGKEK